jgi:glycosyltransferase involved in cell wall biosynthesis
MNEAQLRLGFYLQRALELVDRRTSRGAAALRAARRAGAWLLRTVPAAPATARVWLDCMAHDLDYDNDARGRAIERRIADCLAGAKPRAGGAGVCLAIPSLGGGGAERQLAQLARGLVAAEVGEITVAVKHAGEPRFDVFAPELGAAGAAVVRIAREARGDDTLELPIIDSDLFAVTRGLFRLFLERRPAAVHGWMDEVGVAAALAGVLAGVPRAVVDLRGFNPTWFETRALGSIRAAMRVLARRADVFFVTNSTPGGEDYQRWLGVRFAQWRVVPNAVDVDALSTDRARIAALRGRFATPGRRLVGGLMRLGAEKDPLRWLDVAREICARRGDVDFVLFGEGPLRERIAVGIRRAGLDARVRLGGFEADRAAALRALDALLVTSRVEGCPNAVLEAQAVGVPVVAVDIPGVRECIAPELRTFLVEGGAVAALADRLEAALGLDREDGEAAGREWLAARYSPAAQRAAYLEVYGVPVPSAPRTSNVRVT